MDREVEAAGGVGGGGLGLGGDRRGKRRAIAAAEPFGGAAFAGREGALADQDARFLDRSIAIVLSSGPVQEVGRVRKACGAASRAAFDHGQGAGDRAEAFGVVAGLHRHPPQRLFDRDDLLVGGDRDVGDPHPVVGGAQRGFLEAVDVGDRDPTRRPRRDGGRGCRRGRWRLLRLRPASPARPRSGCCPGSAVCRPRSPRRGSGAGPGGCRSSPPAGRRSGCAASLRVRLRRRR